MTYLIIGLLGIIMLLLWYATRRVIKGLDSVTVIRNPKEIKEIEILESTSSFRTLMIIKLRENIYKEHWREMNHYRALGRLKEEMLELQEAIYNNHPLIDVQRECADVANFAMFISEIYKPNLLLDLSKEQVRNEEEDNG